MAVTRATILDGDKVRYRVYTSPTEFIAVIAENALMAVKTAGVAEPHRIVRDLPTEGVSLKAEKLARQEVAEQVMLAMAPVERSQAMTTEIAPVSPLADDFVPLHLRDLERRMGDARSILTLRDIFGDGLTARPETSPTPVRVLPPEPPAKPAEIKRDDPISEAAPEAEVLSPTDVAALLAASEKD